MKKILITGCDRGLGCALAGEFIKKGFFVFAGKYFKHDGQLDLLQSENPDKMLTVALDITDDASVADAVVNISRYTDSLDILLNNAGILGDTINTIADSIDFADIQRTYATNAIGPLRVSNAFYPFLLKGTDKLIANISSEAGSIADCHRTAWFGYCMSKAALNASAAIIHNRLKEDGGQVMQLHPGWVKTYMSGEKNEAATYEPEFAASHLSRVILNHEQYRGDHPVYIDLFGTKLNW